MRQLIIPVAAAIALVGAPAWANHHEGAGHGAKAADPNGMPPAAAAMQPIDDPTFMKNAAMGGLAEVSQGKLAAARASTEAVKRLAHMMVKDHTKANEELKGLARKHGVALPTVLDPEHQKKEAALSTHKGAAFDKAYVDGQVSAHEKTVALFEAEAKHGKNAEAKAWAAKTLPTLRMHLDHAKNVQKGEPMGHGTGH